MHVVAARRTPIASRSRALSAVTVDALGAAAIRAAVADAVRGGLAEPVADVVLGNCMGPGGNPARLAALAAGLGYAVPGVTVDRQCGSGLAAVIDAANAIAAGDPRPRVAGGVESASTAPQRSTGGAVYARAPFAPAGFPDPDMRDAADDLARALGISRARQDAYAVRSLERGWRAHDAGAFAAELAPVGVAVEDELPARSTALAMPRFRPLREGGSVTAGNACRISDGAAALVLAPRALPGAPSLRVRAHAVEGCDPALPGLGAAVAATAALRRAGVRLGEVDAIEVVEAFAAQTLAVLQTLGLDDDDPRVCADGGALALGHPWGASAAVSVVRLFSRLARGDARPGALGLAAASVGGGLGVAMVLELVR